MSALTIRDLGIASSKAVVVPPVLKRLNMCSRSIDPAPWALDDPT